MNSSVADSPALSVITAYRIPKWSRYPEIVPAAPNREWMDVGTKGWANRCLPLRIANQTGWWILNDADFDVTWDGGAGLESLRITPADPSLEPIFASSMFGYGILTISIPFLFRTPPQCNLIVRGPTNFFKDGAAPLDGIVEADWTPYTFTMNWKITRAKTAVRFSKSEPICMLLPAQRGQMNQFEGEIRNLESAPELLAGYTTWHQQRVARETERRAAQAATRQPVQGHYIRGEGYLGESGDGHQTKLAVKGFASLEPPIPRPAEPAGATPQSQEKTSWWQRRGGK